MTPAAARRASRVRYVEKPGNHGTLFLFRIAYRDKYDDACPRLSWNTWAYDVEHAVDRFHDSDDEGWEILGVEKVRET